MHDFIWSIVSAGVLSCFTPAASGPANCEMAQWPDPGKAVSVKAIGSEGVSKWDSKWDISAAQKIGIQLSEQAVRLKMQAKSLEPQFAKYTEILVKRAQQMQSTARMMITLSITGGGPAEFSKLIKPLATEAGGAMQLSMALADWASKEKTWPRLKSPAIC